MYKKIFGKTEKIHFVGIGGSGMSGIAEVLLAIGFDVTGSDISDSETVRRLKKLGAKVFLGHRMDNVENDVDVVVFSSAINDTNPELKKAKKMNIPIIPRAEMLSELMRLKRGIAVAGTHGKTTTSSMIGNIFLTAKLNPTTIIGGKLFNIDSNAKLGKGEFLICEADESDGSFLKLSPEIVVVTNIDDDHLDFYQNMKNLKNAFINFINKIPFYGFAVLCVDDKNIREIIPYLKKNIITYGMDKDADYRIVNIRNFRDGSCFDLITKNEKICDIKISKFGIHNILNATASFIVGYELGIKLKKIINGLASFSGVERRLEVVGEKNGIIVMDDYGHHPTEIKTTLEALKKLKYKNLIVIFQPHRYTRTKILYKKFGKAFANADFVIIMEIYPAGEKPIKGASSRLIFNEIKKNMKNVFYLTDKKKIIDKVKSICSRGDMILTLGAGDIKYLGKDLLVML